MTTFSSKRSLFHPRARGRASIGARSVCGLGAALLLGACGDAADAINDFYDSFDASVVLPGGDASVDAGGFVWDAAVGGWDASVSGDAGVLVDGGATLDGGADGGALDSGTGDAAAGDGAVSDAAVGDAGLPDASATDGSVADGSVGDGSVADGSVGEGGAGSLCHLDYNQVVLIGDSYLDLSDDIPRMLEAHARNAGALPANREYIDHSLSGASITNFPNIPEQWPNALAEAKNSGSKGVKLVIGTGGGNDVLVLNRPCLDFQRASDITAACKKVVTDTVAAGTKMFDQMATDGVEEMIYFFYPHLPEGQIFGFQGPYPNTILDYAYPFVKKMCDEQVKPRCHFIDTRPAFAGKTAQYISPFDGIHPTPAGSQVIADLIWGVMQDKCLASQ